MNVRIFISSIFILISGYAYSQDMERVHKTINDLCSKKNHGRGAAFGGDSLAAVYLGNEFKTIGLTTLLPDYYQSFTYGINTFPGKMFLKTDKTLKPGEDYIVKSTSGSGKGSYSVYWLDTLLFSDESKWNSFLQTDISQKILVYPKKYFKEFNEKTPDLINHIYSAQAIIELQDKKLTMGLADQSFEKPVFEVLSSSFPQTIKNVSFAVDNKLIKKHKARNVIGFIEGATKKDSFIVITAHYDHLGTLGKKTFFPGANDNASGVSMLLELAHYYKVNAPEYSILFIAFAGEESGLIGSSYFVNHPAIDLKSIHFLINLDLLGTGDDGIMVVNGSIYKKQFNELVSINTKDTLLPAIKARGEAANSDHYPFYKRSVPCFFIYTLGGISAYHDIHDIPSTLPLTKYREVFKLITVFLKSEN